MKGIPSFYTGLYSQDRGGGVALFSPTSPNT